MLPANLAKTRAAGRGAYGELLMLNPSLPSLAAAAYRYSPYTIPSSVAASLSGNANTNLSNNVAAAASALPTPSVHHGLTPSAMAAAAAASSALYPHHSRPHATSSTLYGMDMVQAVAAASAAAAAASGAASGCVGGSAGMGAGALLGGHTSVAGCKRAMAAAAAAAAVAAGVNRGPPALTYSMSDLMGLQGLDVSSMYHAIPTMGL